MRVTLATSRRLQTLIRCLEKKWRSVEAKLKQGLQVRKEEGEEVKEDELSNSQLVLMPIRGAVIKEEEELVVTEVKQRPKVKIKLTGLVEEEEAGGQDPDQEGSKFEEIFQMQGRSKDEGEDEEEEDSKRENENGVTSENVEQTNMRDFEEMLGHRQLEKTEEENGDEGVEANTSIDTCEENSNDEPSRSQDDVIQSPRLERIEEEDEGGGEVVEEFLFDLSDPEGSRSPLPPEDLEEIDGLEDEEDGFKEEEEEVVKEEEEEVKEELKGEDRKWGDPRQGWNLSEAGTLTIGDLYCLLGGREGSCLRLDYGWKGAESLERCSDLLTRLVRLAGAARAQNRGRTNSQSSPSVSRSSNSGTVSSPVTSHRSPVARTGLLLSPVGRPMHAQAGGVSKQILLPAPPNNATHSGSQGGGARSSSPLAVPLEPEPEFRKPLAPAAPRQQGSMSAAFREQIGQYLPKFSNRRGRQNRSRAKQVVGRQLLQPLQPAPPPQILQPLLLVQEVVANPSAQQQQQSTATSSSSLQQQSPTPPALPPSLKGISPVLHHSPQSPPQISIPSPRRSPSPTPSFSCLMDLSFPGWIFLQSPNGIMYHVSCIMYHVSCIM